MLIIRYDFKQMVKILTGLLIFYWGLFTLVAQGIPIVETNIVRKFDMLLLGEKHLYSGFGVYFDPGDF